MTLTTEQLRARAEALRGEAFGWANKGFSFESQRLSETAAALDELAANREAQPVPTGKFAGWGLYHATDDRFSSWIHPQPRDQSYLDSLKPGYANIKLFTAPPAPAVPEEATPDSIEILASARRRDHAVFQWDEDQRNAAADSWNACRSAMLAQPVSGGYKLVPIDPTEEMLRAAYRESGVYSAKAYRAMLAAAPEGGNDHDTRR
ncbi:hypothetical protein AAHE01_24060 [Serratia marcescens]